MMFIESSEVKFYAFWLLDDPKQLPNFHKIHCDTGPYRFCADKSTEQYHYGVFLFCYHGVGIYCTVDDTVQELVQNMTPLHGSVSTIPPQPLNDLHKDIMLVMTEIEKKVGELVKLRTFLPPNVVFNPQQQLVYVNLKTNSQSLISAVKDPYEINYGNLTLYCIDDNTLPNKTRWSCISKCPNTQRYIHPSTL
jgi:hypothetical protein